MGSASMSRTKDDFFEVLVFFSKATYSQKFEYMKKHWGNITSNMTINYCDGCSITISLDSSQKYHFDFECKSINLEEFALRLPEYADSLFELGEDNFKKKYPEIQHFSVESIDNENINQEELDTEFSQEKEIQEESLKEQKITDFSYLNLYNGIKINKRD